jgi:5-hydroxyisourate hydrolase
MISASAAAGERGHGMPLASMVTRRASLPGVAPPLGQIACNPGQNPVRLAPGRAFPAVLMRGTEKPRFIGDAWVRGGPQPVARLTTHVLDTAQGRPAAGMTLELYALAGARRLIAASVTNQDGRLDGPLGEGGAVPPGAYELVFQAGDYFRAQGLRLPDPPFLDQVVLRFGIAETDGRYHVPLLISPWSYSTYRGS